MRPPWDDPGRRRRQIPRNLSVGALRSPQRLDAVRRRRGANTRTKLKEMQDLFWQEAKKYQVLPLDATVATRLVTPRPSITAGRNDLHLDQRRSPARRTATRRAVLNASYTFTAEVDVPQGRRRGDADHPGRPVRRLRLLPAQGQAGLHLEPRRPQAVRWEGPDALAPGKHTLEFDFKYDGLGDRDARLQQA